MNKHSVLKDYNNRLKSTPEGYLLHQAGLDAESVLQIRAASEAATVSNKQYEFFADDFSDYDAKPTKGVLTFTATIGSDEYHMSVTVRGDDVDENTFRDKYPTDAALVEAAWVRSLMLESKALTQAVAVKSLKDKGMIPADFNWAKVLELAKIYNSVAEYGDPQKVIAAAKAAGKEVLMGVALCYECYAEIKALERATGVTYLETTVDFVERMHKDAGVETSAKNVSKLAVMIKGALRH